MGGLMGDRTAKEQPNVAPMEFSDSRAYDDGAVVYRLKDVFKRTGIPLFVNIGLTVICICLLCASIGDNEGEFQGNWDGIFYLAVCVFILLALISILFVIIVRRLFGMSRSIHFVLAMLSWFCAILMLAASIAVAANIKRDNILEYCWRPNKCFYRVWNGDIYIAATVFGFITFVCLLVQAVCHLNDRRTNAFAAPS